MCTTGLHDGVARRGCTEGSPGCTHGGAPSGCSGATPLPCRPQAMPLLKKAPKEEEEDGDPFAASPESRYRRRATLERLVGLAPFGRARRPGPKSGDGDGDGDGGRARGLRRRSEDFGLLRRLPGRRKASVETLSERPVPKRSSLLRLALGTKGRRGSLAERSPGSPEPDGAPDGDGDGGGRRQEARSKAKEPLSGERGWGRGGGGEVGGDVGTWGHWDGDVGMGRGDTGMGTWG